MSDERIPPLRLRDAARLEDSLGTLPTPGPVPALIVLIGLPGSGKSHFARALAARYPAVILDSDRLRTVLIARPEHTEREHRRLFPAMHLLIDRLLNRGMSVIVDATNLKESNRRPYYALAKGHSVRLLLIRIWAPSSVVKQRLRGRETTPGPEDWSSATEEVYEGMRRDVRRITRRHLSINTTKPLGPYLDKAIDLLQS